MHMRNMCEKVGAAVFLLLMIVYLGVYTVKGQNCTCEEISKCQNASSDICNMQNVAYKKRAFMSSSTENHRACMAVNGDTTTLLYTSDSNKTNCAESADGDYNAWWAVDLGQTYTVRNITIHRETSIFSGRHRMTDLVLKVDDKLCFTFPTYNSENFTKLPATIDIVCEPTITGQVVRLEKVNTIKDSNYYTITVCEVQVWVASTTSPESTTTTYANSISTHAGMSSSRGDTATSYGSNVTTQTQTTTNYGSSVITQTKTTTNYGSSVTTQTETTTNYENTTPNLTGINTSDARDAGSNIAVIVGPVVGGAVLLIIIVLITVISVRRKRRWRRKYASHETDKESGSTDHRMERHASVKPVSFAPIELKVRESKETRQSKPMIALKPRAYTTPANNASGSADFWMNAAGEAQTQTVPRASNGDLSSSAPDSAAVVDATHGLDRESFHTQTERAPSAESTARAPRRAQKAIGASGTGSAVSVSSASVPTTARKSEVDQLSEVPSVADGVTGAAHDREYQNGEDVYAIFKASRPDLDNVQQYLVDRLASGELREEFRDMQSGLNLPRGSSNLDANFKKNRFASILPYDSNRVVLLDGYDRSGATDFVNASYISGYASKKAYIAAQGPRDNTVVDFWRMVWQEKVTHIVMLTNVVEAGKNKCWEYWPAANGRQKYGPFAVASVNIEERASFVIRTFKLKHSKNHENREVVQYHYVSWPDHDVPTTTSLITFWRFVKARTAHSSTAPILVHCSAGVGRSGTFIGLDIGFQMAVKEGKVHVKKLVKRLRGERCWMVQAQEQYDFLHKVLLEAYTARDTFMSMGEFVSTFSEPVSAHTPNPRIDKEFKTLVQMRSLTPAKTHETAEQTDNAAKNRNPDDLPPDRNLVFLTECLLDRNQYINAAFMSTFWHERGCIVTQLPLPDTLVDFWRMVYGEHVQTVVSLADSNEEAKVKPYCWYWPRGEGETIEAGPYTIHFQSKSTVGNRVTSYTLKLDKEGVSSGSRAVRVLRYEDWTEEVPANTSDLMHLVQALDNTHSGGKDKKHPGSKDNTHMGDKMQAVVIQCSDGVSKSGLFNAVCDVIHRMTIDREIDVYMTVRHMQSVRPKAVTSEAQYRYLFELVQREAGEMSVYANV